MVRCLSFAIARNSMLKVKNSKLVKPVKLVNMKKYNRPQTSAIALEVKNDMCLSFGIEAVSSVSTSVTYGGNSTNKVGE